MPEQEIAADIVAALVRHGHAGTTGDMLPGYQAHELATAIYRDVVAGIVTSWMDATDHAVKALDEERALRRSERSSRQAWAEEAVRLDGQLEGRRRQIARALNLHHMASWAELQTAGTTYAEQWLDNIAAEINAEEVAKRAEPPSSVCACIPDDEATALVDAGWSLPQCTVHPEAGGA